MQANIKLGRIFGIEVGLHYSWLIIALLPEFSGALTSQFCDYLTTATEQGACPQENLRLPLRRPASVILRRAWVKLTLLLHVPNAR